MKPGLFLALALSATPCLADPAAGVAALQDTSDADRPLSLSVWYPSAAEASASIGGNAVFEGAPAAPEAPFPDAAFPLVVVSHGGLRSARDSGAWLSAAIAQAGYVVVEVNAPRPDNAALALDEIWQRPRDIRRAIDLMLADATWGPRVEDSQVAVAGFALGATAALSVAGAELDAAQYLRSCAPDNSTTGPDCGWFAAQGVDVSKTSAAALAGLARDPRVDAVIAISPEYPDALGQMPAAVGALRISLGPSDAAPGAGQVGQSVVIPGASVFDGFPVCTAAGPEILTEDGGDPAICGASAEARRTIHEDIAEAIITFLKGDPT